MGDGLACTTYPRARKEHRCEECGRKIEIGEIYVRYAGTWEGDFFTNVACQQCAALRKIAGDLDSYYWEVYYGGLAEWVWNRSWTDVKWVDEAQLIHLLRLIAGFKADWKTKAGNPWPTAVSVG